MGWPVLPVQVPTVWPSHSTQDLHETPTTSSCEDEEKGSSPDHVPGRYPCDGTKESLKEHQSQLASVLQSLGFTLNQQKCVWEPTRRIEFLGFIVDSETQVTSLPGNKLSKIQKECRSMSSKDRVSLIPRPCGRRKKWPGIHCLRMREKPHDFMGYRTPSFMNR